MSDNEKDKEIKKMSEVESYNEYEGEGIEDVEEVPDSVSEVAVPLVDSRADQSFTVCDSEEEFEKEFEEVSSGVSDEQERQRILREKWLSVTGKKPRTIPVVRKPVDVQKFVFFGDMRPMEVERNIHNRLLVMSKKIESAGLEFGRVRQEIKTTSVIIGLLCVQFDPTAEYMACSNKNGKILIHETRTGEWHMTLQTAEETNHQALRYLKYSPRNPKRLYAVGDSGKVEVYNTETGKALGATEDYTCMYVMDISPDGHLLATGGKNGNIQVIDPNTLQVISRKELPKNDEFVQPTIYNEYHRLRVYGMRFHPMKMGIFATGSWDNTVKIWDARTNGAVRSINGVTIHGDGLDIRASCPNIRIRMHAVRMENSLNLWDFNSGRLIKNIPIKSKSTKFEGEFLYCCRFFKDEPAYPEVNRDMVAVSGSGFFNVIVINSATDTIQCYFPSFKPAMCLDVNGKMLVYGGMESVLRIAEVKTKQKTVPRKSTL